MEAGGGTDRRRTAGNGLEETSLAELMQRLTDQSSALARKEVELAKAELAQKGRQIGIGAGAFGAAGVTVLFAAGALVAAAILALDLAVAGWLAAVLVAAVLAAVAAILALAGKRKVEEGTPPMPERAIESSREDVDAAKAAVKEGRNG
jgi:MFS family permease